MQRLRTRNWSFREAVESSSEPGLGQASIENENVRPLRTHSGFGVYSKLRATCGQVGKKKKKDCLGRKFRF